jgi:hypothetical protein
MPSALPALETGSDRGNLACDLIDVTSVCPAASSPDVHMWKPARKVRYLVPEFEGIAILKVAEFA